MQWKAVAILTNRHISQNHIFSDNILNGFIYIILQHCNTARHWYILHLKEENIYRQEKKHKVIYRKENDSLVIHPSIYSNNMSAVYTVLAERDK